MKMLHTARLHLVIERVMQRAKAQQAELGELIQRIRAVLSEDERAVEYFGAELEWLDRRERLWQSDAFRIGLIGVTSSGKSTLVNALLTTELLPYAVRPSSNCLIVCEWGERLECVVHFNEPGRKPRAIMGSAIAKTLADYADEARNPNNRKDVQEIRVRSPHFKFGKGVALIDTPGLDAFGHEDHEKLTLEVLLPTVDVVVFVTTCKSNSDEKVREYVRVARDYKKPVIVVQNMIDNVEEKPGVHGEILKSRTEVLDEHRRRLESVLKRAEVGAVAISQVSAIWALKRPDLSSGVPAFVDSVQEQLDALAPTIAEGRRTQLNTWLSNIIEKELEPGDPSAVLRRQKAEITRLSRLSSELHERYARLTSAAEKGPRFASARAEALLEEAAALSSTGIDEAIALKASVDKWLQSSASSLSSLNKQLIEQIAADCESLNLRADDMDLSARFRRTASKFEFSTTDRTRTVRTEQSGLWGRVKRVFGGGYDERTVRWTEIDDFDSFRTAVEKAIRSESAYVDRFSAAIVDRIETVSKQFGKELKAREKGIVTKMSATMEGVHRHAIAQQLEEFLTKPRRNRNPAPDKPARVTTPDIEQKRYEIDVEPAVLNLTRLATLIARHRFLEMRDQMWFDQARKRKPQNDRVLILGFDSASLGDFVNRFWFDLIESDGGRPLTFASHRIDDGAISDIAVASLGDGVSERTRTAVDRFLSEPCVLFLVLDVDQIGSTKSTLERSGIAFGELKQPIVAVVQSIKVLEESNAIADGLIELHMLGAERNIKFAGVLVNDERVFYSAVANRLIASPTPFETVAGEQQFIKSLDETDRNEAIAIIRKCKVMAV
jgi:GTPase SAR1 family protein